MGVTWIIVGGLIGGASYLLYPSTSLTEVQAFHFLAFHGMGYHGTMVYMGILYFIQGDVEISVKNFKYYFLFLFVVFPIVIALDYIFGVNLMFFRDAYNLHDFVKAVNAWNQPIYTCIVVLFYLVLPYFLIYGIDKVRDFIHKKKENTLFTETEVKE
jgi:hypothetical protein